MTLLSALCRCRASRAFAAAFVLLIVLPTTAPFQTLSFSELLGTPRAELSTASHVPLVVPSARQRHLSQVPLLVPRKETEISVLPPPDPSGGRLKGESRPAGLVDHGMDPRRDAPAGPLIRASFTVHVLRI